MTKIYIVTYLNLQFVDSLPSLCNHGSSGFTNNNKETSVYVCFTFGVERSGGKVKLVPRGPKG